MQKVQFTETVLRDANQSLIATRLPYYKFAPILETMDDAGYYSLECWGGATFDTCLRYLDEDPWERLRNIRATVKNTRLQMLLRGQNILGYKHYPDDVVKTFVERSVANGIDVIRIFDALNDLRNLDSAVTETVRNKAVAQVAVAYTTSPVHSLENYVRLIKRIEEMGATELCIKDMAGVMSPSEAYNLVRAVKSESKLRLNLHTHCTTGLAYMTLLKAVEAGADIIDTCVSCFSGGTSQASTNTLLYALTQLGCETDLKADKAKEINDFFKPIQAEYIASGLLDPKVMGTDADALVYQIPGGMLSNLVSQLKSVNAMDRFDEVLAEVPRVRRDLGYPPLVTPSSQFVGAQAAQNVISGERYKQISKEVKGYLKGEYGTPPGIVNPELISKALGGELPFTGRFADILEPGMERGKLNAGPLARSVEDVLSYIIFPQIALDYFAKREEIEKNVVPYNITRKE
ncbi:MAG: pyruvate carboxylase subunit B [Oscillospiraceae bacterium]|jgi:oxaloacetate decarboxylase alpha subunit|nr:pyruvate carboxylase subunit B [Oscillospiraceae bacterium]